LIDAIIYGLFDLTPEVIALLEASIAGRYWPPSLAAPPFVTPLRGSSG